MSKWELKNIGEVCENSQYGYTTKASGTGKVKFVRTTDISDGSLEWDTVPYCMEEPDDIKKYQLYQGDVLISRAGSVGLSFLIEDAPTAVFASYLIRYRPKIDPKYFYYYLQSPAYWTQVNEGKAGIAVPNLNASKISSFSIPVPDRETQRKIVSKIESLFSEIDKGTQELENAELKIKIYRQSVINAAIQGKLVTQDPNEAPASKLLEKIRSEKESLIKVGRIKKEQPLTQIDQSDVPFEIPLGWVWVRLGELIDNGPTNGIYLPQTKYGEGSPILRIDDFQNGWCRPSQDLRKVKATKEEISNYSLQENDIVINRVNSMTHLGKCIVVSKINVPSIFESNMMRLKLNNGIFPHFIVLWLQSYHGSNLLIQNAKQAVNQASINQTDVKMTPIPLPPVQVQKKISELVVKSISELSAISDSVSNITETVKTLKQSILKKAFEGEL